MLTLTTPKASSGIISTRLSLTLLHDAMSSSETNNTKNFDDFIVTFVIKMVAQ